MSGARPSVAVVGAGVGGLAAGLRLARRGGAVTVFERRAEPGGKLAWRERGGFSWDMGPSLLTMPHVFADLFRDLGERLEDHLSLVKLRSTCRYRWSDGTVLDEDAAFWERPEVAAMLRHAAGLYDLSADAFLHHPLEDWWRQLLRPGTLAKLRHLPKIASFQSLADLGRRFFPRDARLRQWFGRFATYNGSDPERTPAAFAIIPYVQARFGGWYVRGGLHEIARSLRHVGEKLGVRFRFGEEVTGARPAGNGWRLENGEEFDVVVCNQDVLSAYPRFLPGAPWERFRRTRLEPLPLSISGFVLYLGVAREHPGLDHHNILFSDDYASEFRQMFDEKRPADDPTIYVCVHSKSDPDRAPPGCENWFVLVNAPPLDPARPLDWSGLGPAYAERVLDQLEGRWGFAGLRGAIRTREMFTPADFQTRYLAHGGALYGFASHGVLSAFRRPAIQPPGTRNFFFVGGSTHPGGGLPLVALGGKMAAERIIRQWNL